MNKKHEHSGQLLLLEDVLNLGQKGDLVKAKPGFARNFLIPQKKAVIADKRTVRMQEKLKEERAKQAALDKKESEASAAKIKGKTLSIKVKTDKEGNLYGSVTALDVVKLLEEEKIVSCERRCVLLPKPIKTVGTVEVQLCLKEDVATSFFLKIISENQLELVEKGTLVREEGRETAEKKSTQANEKHSRQAKATERAAEIEQPDEDTKQ